MTHFGIICPPVAGHLYLMTTLGYELKQRGHRVSLVGIPDTRVKAEAIGLEFIEIGEKDFPLGTSKEKFFLGELTGIASLKYAFKILEELAEVLLENAPGAIKEAGIEALLIDQLSVGRNVAEFLGLPYITISCNLLQNRENSIPPFDTLWQYNPAWWAVLRNQFGYQIKNILSAPLKKTVVKYRQKWNLPMTPYYPLAVISQLPAEFEFPRQKLPQWLHFTGPFSATREPVSFPWEKLTGQPLVYASMGTLQNRSLDVFKIIARACGGLDVQLVISLGGGLSPESLPQLPGNPIVVGYAPQLELLQKATLTITHAGLNTVMESLSNGVPMVAVPAMTNDHPGTAVRIAWTGVGEVVPLKRLKVSSLQKAIAKVLTEDSYKQNAMRLQEGIKRAGGVIRAADIIEKAVVTGKPVLSS